jgi:hypothetical protein
MCFSHELHKLIRAKNLWHAYSFQNSHSRTFGAPKCMKMSAGETPWLSGAAFDCLLGIGIGIDFAIAVAIGFYHSDF